MAIPATRSDFKQYVLRRLGFPTVKVRVTDEQLDDRVDDALDKYILQHYDGSEKTYLAHVLTVPECSAKMVTMDAGIIGVTNVWPIGFSTSLSGGGLLFNVPYQVMLSEIFGTNGAGMMQSGMSDYVIMRQNLCMVEQWMIGRFPIRYNDKTNQLFLDVAPETLIPGGFIIIEGYKAIVPDDFPNIWSDIWLQKYTTELVRKQWGQNLSAYAGITLPGGITTTGVQMIAAATEEITKLEDELITTFSPISNDFIG